MFGTTTRTIPTRFRRTAVVGIVGIVAASLTALSACGSSDGATTTVGAETTAAPVTALTLSGAWIRTTPAGTTTGAAYVTITSPVDDALLSVMVDASIAADGAEMHEMVMADGSSMTDSTMTGGTGGMGEMTMQPVYRVEVPAGTSVSFAPGGRHIMLLGLVQPLEQGTTVKVTFVFEQAGPVTIDVPVLDEAPMP